MQKERWAYCINCGYGETLLFRRGKLEGREQDGVIYYGKFKQINGQVYHHCHDRWSLCKLYSDFMEVKDG